MKSQPGGEFLQSSEVSRGLQQRQRGASNDRSHSPLPLQSLGHDNNLLKERRQINILSYKRKMYSFTGTDYATYSGHTTSNLGHFIRPPDIPGSCIISASFSHIIGSS